ncbi:MAG: phospholipase D family protein [Candidatus Auribacterota bacterium]|nr:phospholipase D family protein [Candidatus Auribacterota bacterium]
MKIILTLVLISLIVLPVFAGEEDSPCRMEVFFGPTGGLAPRNFNKKVTLLQPDLENEKNVAGNLSNPLTDMIRRAKKTIDIASYILNNRSDEYYELLKANQRGVRIRIFLDESIKDFITEKPIIDPMVEELARERPIIEVKVLDSEKTEKLTGIPFKTMHEKFGIFDSTDCYNGSANISPLSTLLYHENRFFFWNCPDAVTAFQGEFDRLWEMGRWRIKAEVIGKEKKVEED